MEIIETPAQGCCSSQGNESIAFPIEEKCIVEDNSEDSDGDIEIEELSESESLASIEIRIETSIDEPQTKERTETAIKTLNASRSKEKFHLGEIVLCYEPHFYMIHKAKIVSRSKKKGCYWVNYEGWSSEQNVEIKRDLLMKDTPVNCDLMEEVNKVKEEGGEGVKFIVGEEVLCYEPDLKKVNKIYEAKIVRVLCAANETEVSYVVHFPGWGNKHNRRVDRSLLLKDIPVHRELMERVNLMMDQRISKKRKTSKKTKKISAEQLSSSQTSYTQG